MLLSMRPPLLPALVLLTATLLSGRAAEDAVWRIHLDRPCTVGERCTVTSSGNQVRHNKSNLPGQPPEDAVDKLEVSYTGTHEVLAVGKNGLPLKMRLTVDKLETNDGSGSMSQFTPGTVLEARAEGNETKFYQGRDLLEGTLADALNLAGANLGSVNEQSEDDVFRTQEAVRPGTKLMADSKLLARAITVTTPFIVDTGGSSAELVLEKSGDLNNIPSLYTASKFHIALRGFKNSPGQQLKDSFMRSSTQRVLPVDPALPLLRETIDTDMRISTRPAAKGGPDNAPSADGRDSGGSGDEGNDHDKDGGKENSGGSAGEDDGEDDSPGFTTTFHRSATRDIKPLEPASPSASKSADPPQKP